MEDHTGPVASGAALGWATRKYCGVRKKKTIDPSSSLEEVLSVLLFSKNTI